MLLGADATTSTSAAMPKPRRLKKVKMSATGPNTIAGSTITAAAAARDSTSYQPET